MIDQGIILDSAGGIVERATPRVAPYAGFGYSVGFLGAIAVVDARALQGRVCVCACACVSLCVGRAVSMILEFSGSDPVLLAVHVWYLCERDARITARRCVF